MPEQDNRSNRAKENSASFLTLAKEAALRKVADIMGGSDFYAHGFVRFGPYWAKAGHNLAPLAEDIDPSIDRLKGNLRWGILSAEAARRRGIKLSRNWSDPNNQDAVSLVDKYAGSYIDAFNVAIAAARGQNRNIEIPEGELWALLIDPELETHGEDPNAIEKGERSVLRKGRVPRGRLRGLVNSDFLLADSVVDDAVSVMSEVYYHRPQLFLPIYNGAGDLYWPERVVSSNIKDFLRERGIYQSTVVDRGT